MRDETKLFEFLEALFASEVHEAPKEEEWRNLIERISQPGRNERISRAVHRYFQEVLPPHYLGDDFFAFAEGAEPIRLFARRDGKFLCRQLTVEQTATFCDLAGIDLPD